MLARKNYQIGRWLKDEGVDVFLVETMNSISETKACLDAISEFNLPIWISFVLKSSKELLSGEKLEDAIIALKDYNVDVLLLNCNPLDRTQDAINIVSENWNGEWGIYPNLGIGEPSPDGIIESVHSDEDYISLMDESVKLGATILGACCGSNTRHIKLISRKFAGINE